MYSRSYTDQYRFILSYTNDRSPLTKVNSDFSEILTRVSATNRILVNKETAFGIGNASAELVVVHFDFLLIVERMVRIPAVFGVQNINTELFQLVSHLSTLSRRYLSPASL